MNKSFNKGFALYRFFFFIVFAIIVIGFIVKGSLMLSMFNSKESVFRIDVPEYNGTSTSYFTDSYTIDENRCIRFVDEMKFQQQICNNYNIVKLK